MKHWLFSVALICLCVLPSQARVAGKLDIYSDPQAIVLRDLRDGLWLVGMQKNIWKLVNTNAVSLATREPIEVLHVSFFVASRLEGQSPVYGPSVGTNVGALGTHLAEKLSLLRAVTDSTPPWLGKIADWVSIDFYGGYRPVIQYDDHHWVYGIGGQLRIPFSQAVRWAQGSRNDGTPDTKGL